MQIGQKIGWPAQEIEYFCDLVECEHARSLVRKEEAVKRLRSRHQAFESQKLSLDAFQVVSDWHHYAILELCLLQDFKSDPVWMAKKLGIDEMVVVSAIDRMSRLGLIEIHQDSIRPTSSWTASPDQIPSDAIRKFHCQILSKALLAIENQRVEDRDFSGMVLAIDKDQIQEAKEAIKNFRREFDTHFGNQKEKNDVYCLSIQFYSLLSHK